MSRFRQRILMNVFTAVGLTLVFASLRLNLGGWYTLVAGALCLTAGIACMLGALSSNRESP